MEQINAVLRGAAGEDVDEDDRAIGDVVQDALVEEEVLAEEFLLEEVVEEEEIAVEVLNNAAKETMAADENVACSSSDEFPVRESCIDADDDVDLNEPLPMETIYVDCSEPPRPVIRDDDQQDILAAVCAEIGLSLSD
jgi:hypothetical protein